MVLRKHTIPMAQFGSVLPRHVESLPDDYAYCRQIMHAASRNYSFAAGLLPTAKRHHVEALYALLRVGDDRVDVSHEGFASPLKAIDHWEAGYWHAFDIGDSPNPVLRAYLHTAQECSIPKEVMVPYFRAMREDLTIKRFHTFADLMRYMDGSALPVGRAMTHILGVRAPHQIADALPGADSLSIAMQLSNFWRDIGEDWRIGRVYIPQEDMERFDLTEGDIARGKVTSPLIDLLEFEFARTESYYQEAKRGAALLASGRWGVLSALAIYRGILSDIRANNYDVFTRRAGTSTSQKLGLLAWAAATALPQGT
jgi:15-cis-phytoene synthase